MPIPRINSIEVRATYAEVTNEHAAADLVQAVNRLATHFKVDDKVPRRAAAVVYLGLCRLKAYTEAGEIRQGREYCMQLFNVLEAPNGGGIRVNCSFFKSERKSGEKIDHEDAIKRACRVYLPLRRSLNKGCLMLMALGAQHAVGTPLPPDDTWLTNFNFDPTV